MQIITSITDEPKQSFVLRLENNESATIKLYYYESQNSWYFDVQYKDYINAGNKVVLTFNALRHLKKILPFGIGFISVSQADPYALDAFSSGNFMMTLLTADDVQTFEEVVYNEPAV